MEREVQYGLALVEIVDLPGEDPKEEWKIDHHTDWWGSHPKRPGHVRNIDLKPLVGDLPL